MVTLSTCLIEGTVQFVVSFWVGCNRDPRCKVVRACLVSYTSIKISCFCDGNVIIKFRAVIIVYLLVF
jgi:hypothetical protein